MAGEPAGSRALTRLDLALLPAEATAIQADCYVTIDVLRATTTMATLFAHGLADLIAVDDLDTARRRAREENRILFGEVGGLPPEGFDYGNSPVEAASLDIAGKGAVLFTTNGTRALCALAGRGAVITGAFANAGAAAVAAGAYEHVAIVCAGTDGGTRFALDDFATATRLVRLLTRAHPGVALGDAASMASELRAYEEMIASSIQREPETGSGLVMAASHARHLAELGLAADIAYAVREDTSAAVPSVVEWGPGWARLEDGAR